MIIHNTRTRRRVYFWFTVAIGVIYIGLASLGFIMMYFDDEELLESGTCRCGPCEDICASLDRGPERLEALAKRMKDLSAGVDQTTKEVDNLEKLLKEVEAQRVLCETKEALRIKNNQ